MFLTCVGMYDKLNGLTSLRARSRFPHPRIKSHLKPVLKIVEMDTHAPPSSPLCGLVSRPPPLLVGNLSNYDEDHNDDFTKKKKIGLMIKTAALHVHAF